MDQRSTAPVALADEVGHVAGRATTMGPPLAAHSVRGWVSLVTRLGGAVAVLVVGVVHLQAYGGPYSAVPTIGTLFLLNFAAATTLGAALLLPLERLARRWGAAAVVSATVAGIVLTGVSLAMLIVAENGTLFGFHEPGYDPEAITRSRQAEIASAVLLATSLATRWPARSRPRW